MVVLLLQGATILSRIEVHRVEKILIKNWLQRPRGHRLPIAGHGLIKTPEVLQYIAKPVVSDGHLRRGFRRRLVIRQRFVKASLMLKNDAAVVVGGGIVRLQLQRSVETIEGFGELALYRQREREAAVVAWLRCVPGNGLGDQINSRFR